MSYFLFASMGNDSIALIQYMALKLSHAGPEEEVHVIYTNTGWASEEWPERVRRGADLAEGFLFRFVELQSEGMESLVMRKGAWPKPASNMQFCTGELKVKPAVAYMDEIDPDREWVCLNGVRRAESENRSDSPEYVEHSGRHGGRSLWSPLVNLSDVQRNELIALTGIPVLPHRSRECFPCISGKRDTLRALPESKLVQIEGIEQRMGFTKKKNAPKTMFRPYRHMGATGIREVKKWADSERGKYGSIYDGEGQMCLGGWCGE